MSLRDWFAGHAMAMVVRRMELGDPTKSLAATSYMVADSLALNCLSYTQGLGTSE